MGIWINEDEARRTFIPKKVKKDKEKEIQGNEDGYLKSCHFRQGLYANQRFLTGTLYALSKK